MEREEAFAVGRGVERCSLEMQHEHEACGSRDRIFWGAIALNQGSKAQALLYREIWDGIWGVSQSAVVVVVPVGCRGLGKLSGSFGEHAWGGSRLPQCSVFQREQQAAVGTETEADERVWNSQVVATE